MTIELNADTLRRLKLDPNFDYQYEPITVTRIIPIRRSMQTKSSYSLFLRSTDNGNQAMLSQEFPNDNAYIFSRISATTNAQFNAVGTASSQQIQDYFRRQSRVVFYEGNTELFSANLYEYGDVRSYYDDSQLIVTPREGDDMIALSTPLFVGVRDQFRGEFFTPKTLLTTTNPAGNMPYLDQVDDANNTDYFTLLNLRMRGVKVIAQPR
ncbi:MAG TPA: hypothetical protein DIS79_06385 [Bacteroidetes bacterium]|nr:hypothetical protein [Bacteroidota bacterium]HRK04092.1 hypothetical protein [Chlorobiota bacterium]